MIEVAGDLWKVPACARVIPTNSLYKWQHKRPIAVMGAGMAKQAAIRYADLPERIGEDLRLDGGPRVRAYATHKDIIIAFPTKYDWRQPSDLALIERSAHQLVAVVDERQWIEVVLPRVGSGLGQLPWNDVKSVIEPILDDRFIVVTRPGEQ